jgi:integrase
LKAFFAWAVNLRLIDRDPTSVMKSIKFDGRQTLPLTALQFDELLAATQLHDADPARVTHQRGYELKALFLLMRWSGLRIGDSLTMARSSLSGNRLDLMTRKTKAHYLGTLPDHVAETLNSLPKQSGIHPDYFFWSRTCTYESLASTWGHSIRELNRHIHFIDDHGHPLQFHSHMLRDTFAVELLLAGVSLEDVSRLLTHKSVRITERYYASCIKARQVQLEDKLVAAMRRMGVTVSGGGAS